MTIEKMLEFAYGIKNYIIEKDDKNTLAYKKVCEVISDCKNEIAYKAAKAGGRSNEKSRTKAAQNIIAKCERENLRGHKKLPDGNIAIVNGFCLYIGNPIIGIEEVEHPENFFDVDNFIKTVNYPEGINVFDLDIGEIKAKYKIAKTKAKTMKLKGTPLFKCFKNAIVEIENNNGNKVYFDAELIIDACDMVGGNEITIQVSDGRAEIKPGIIRGENGTCYVMPFKHCESNYKFEDEEI